MNHYHDSGVKNVSDALRELRVMHSQIIHGSSIFGDIADILENLANERADFKLQRDALL